MSWCRIPADEQVWEAYAESYDHILPILPFYQEAVRRHVNRLTGASIQRVIDVGAGTGNVAVQLAPRGVEVTAIDISRAMLDQLRGKKRSARPPRSKSSSKTHTRSTAGRLLSSMARMCCWHCSRCLNPDTFFARSFACSAQGDLSWPRRPGGASN
jgi:SAM-dependent methyltransferase